MLHIQERLHFINFIRMVSKVKVHSWMQQTTAALDRCIWDDPAVVSGQFNGLDSDLLILCLTVVFLRAPHWDPFFCWYLCCFF